MREAGLDAGAIGAARARATRSSRRRTVLTRADQAIGDGDHGVGMARGFRAARAAIEARQAATAGRSLQGRRHGDPDPAAAAPRAQSSAPSSSRPPARCRQRHPRWPSFAAALAAALRASRNAAAPRPGTRPSWMRWPPPPPRPPRETTSPPRRRPPRKRREQGAEATRPMVARFGKAKTLGDRSIGHPDPGALTLSIVLRSLATSLAE